MVLNWPTSLSIGNLDMKADVNPAPKALDVFVGTWVVELSNAPFFPDPKATVRIRCHSNGSRAGTSW